MRDAFWGGVTMRKWRFQLSWAIMLMGLLSFPASLRSLVQGEWERFDQAAMERKKICSDTRNRKWFSAADCLWTLDRSEWAELIRSAGKRARSPRRRLYPGRDHV